MQSNMRFVGLKGRRDLNRCAPRDELKEFELSISTGSCK